MVASITLKPPAFFLLVFATLILLVWNKDRLTLSYYSMTKSEAEWSSNFEGWYSRSTPHDSTFTPTREELAFAVLHNAPTDAEGFTLALFQPNIAVDAMGRVRVVEKDDFAGLTSLAQKTLSLPQTDSFWNTWRIAWERTEQVIRRLLVAKESEGELQQTSVQGFSKKRTALQTPVGNFDNLPETLWELFGLVEEALEGYEKNKGNEEMVELVKATLGDV